MGMSVPAREPVPELDAEDALRGVVNQLTVNGEQMTVIIPGPSSRRCARSPSSPVAWEAATCTLLPRACLGSAAE